MDTQPCKVRFTAAMKALKNTSATRQYCCEAHKEQAEAFITGLSALKSVCLAQHKAKNMDDETFIATIDAYSAFLERYSASLLRLFRETNQGPMVHVYIQNCPAASSIQ